MRAVNSCRFASPISAAPEDAVGDADADAVGHQRVGAVGSFRPVGPLLVFEVGELHADSLRQLYVEASAIGESGVTAPAVVVLEVELAVADQNLGVGGGAPEVELVNGQARTDQVVVLVDAVDLIEAQPAAFGFNLDPGSEAHVHISTDAVEVGRARCRNAVAGVIGLKGGGLTAGGDGQAACIGRRDDLGARLRSSCKQQQEKQSNARAPECRSLLGHQYVHPGKGLWTLAVQS